MKTIAISGKGGTGKTTISALIIRWLNEHAAKPILAVDADANVDPGVVESLQLALVNHVTGAAETVTQTQTRPSSGTGTIWNGRGDSVRIG